MTDKINKYAEFMTKQVKEGSFGYPSKSGKQGVGVDARGPVEDGAVSLDEAKKVPAAKTERTSEAAKNLPESEEVKFSDYVAWIAEGDVNESRTAAEIVAANKKLKQKTDASRSFLAARKAKNAMRGTNLVSDDDLEDYGDKVGKAKIGKS